ncbi:hypothetical protein K7X08_023100 [Anisodus acutangulus]|uniref:Uncharacterized protein n=1 Tax=Anisodus acutangulus TaxID=402998 RepID=A0A9Q1RHT4_9SOLA|nr:hypothetical protein K7X08_023100 [Anisodus acutangulus]
MDKKGSGKEISEEVTRESLIAISYSDPEKDLSVRSRSENSKAENVGKAVNVEGDDNCRSKLISMSYPESSDTNFEPVTWRTLKAKLNNPAFCSTLPLQYVLCYR